MANESVKVTITPHRQMLPADSTEQTLFVMLKLKPNKDVASSRPPTNFVCAIDTSSSMDETVSGGKTKRQIVIEALHGLIQNSASLTQNDYIGIVQFDSNSSAVLPLTPAPQTQAIAPAIDNLRNYSGGTYMGDGLEQSLRLFPSKNQAMSSRRLLLFTDGETFDPDVCENVAAQFGDENIPITAIGVGNEFKEDLLTAIVNPNGGRVIRVVPGSAIGTEVSLANLPQEILGTLNEAQKDVVTDLTMNINTVRGVRLTRLLRAYPTFAEFSLDKRPYAIGNATADDETIFILEFKIDSRPASKVSIARVGITYSIPGQNRVDEFPVQNLVVQFVAGQMGVQVDKEVMGFVQQCNITKIVEEATQLAAHSPEKATEKLEMAHKMTVRLGNKELSESLNQGLDELRKTRRLSPGTSKTVKLGAKGKTVRMGGDINDEIPSEEAIRRATGT
jgi:Ca-activated chloride channel family protein